MSLLPDMSLGKLLAREQLGEHGNDGEVSVYAEQESDEDRKLWASYLSKAQAEAEEKERLKAGPELSVTIRTERYSGGRPFKMVYGVTFMRMLHRALSKALEQYPEEKTE